MGYVISRICDDTTSPASAYERAHELCLTAVSLQKVTDIYVGPAIRTLTRKGQFGSWLRKLYHREKVTIHLHFYERLIRIVEQQTKEHHERIHELNAVVRNARGTQHAIDIGSLGSVGSNVGASPTGT